VGNLIQSFPKVQIRPPKNIFEKKSKWVSKNADFYANYKTFGKIAKIITKKKFFTKT